MAPEAKGAPAKSWDISAIAVIDDALIPVSADRLPEQERAAVLALLSEIEDVDAARDLAQRGFDKKACKSTPDAALDALTDPSKGLGDAFALLAGASSALSQIVEERLRVRKIVAAMRSVAKCEVLEIQPNAELPDLNGHQLVFIDYYLDGETGDGSRAEAIAKQVEDSRKPESTQQIVLMSSAERVRTFRTRFRQAAGVDGSSFCFVAKPDLDDTWQVRAHLEMFARALPHSRSIGAYINAAKKNMKKAQEELTSLLDDLDLGDFAYLQNAALRDDGHPLGDYLSWLLSSHLASLAFEEDLRAEQAAVDALNFDYTMLSAAEPSTVVATFYHSALFARNQGALRGHPRFEEGETGADMPMVQLGDVFLDTGRTKAVVVLSADCDLAFAPNAHRPPDPETPVLLVTGTPIAVRKKPGAPATTDTHGMEHGSEVYRIEWEFRSYRTVALNGLAEYLGKSGFQLDNRDRLRPLYGLKLQQEFGSHIFRVGPPVMPPVHMPMGGEIVQWNEESKTKTSVEALEKGALFASWFKDDDALSVRITPSVAGRLRAAVEGLRHAVEERLTTVKALPQNAGTQRAIKWLEPKLTAIEQHLADDGRWAGILGDHKLSASPQRIVNGLYFVHGDTWSPLTNPAIVLQIDHPHSA